MNIKAKQILKDNFNNMVEVLQNTIRYNTEKATAVSGAPFGQNIRDCLDYVLDVSKQMGLSTYNCDGYAGHAQLQGTGEEVLGILGHLDVVPSKAEEWQYPPYGGEIHNGKLFGRGTMDDKGPMIACLFAVDALKKAGFEPSKTVRLIFGCDEESGMQCVTHYFSKMPFPNISFSPDGDFPVINREKGIFQFRVHCGKLPQGVTVTAGDRANVVPSLCIATVAGDVQGQLYGATVSSKDGISTITATGKNAHGSTPDEGINATHAVFKILANNYPQNETLQFVANKLLSTDGSAWGVNLCDEQSGKLTMNLGVVRTTAEGQLVVTIDIRFPISFTCEYMLDLIKSNTPSYFVVEASHPSAPLYVPADSQLVSTLMDIYNTAMNTNLEPLAIGGGTYSRCLPNCVAFGPLFPGEEQTIHMPNECVDLNSLLLMAELYLEAIYQLAK
ncbi:MAG: Sapep family Mn(2+)-dependent dipeptidase [Clostridia bacterium]|nr:Sapep family Mn(2+)-dependent dipeptidase [Clostridia bacterium]MBQ8772089.1 Sapep family Mn(2+)-dependent dipeptidase [Clostridia bacterium]